MSLLQENKPKSLTDMVKSLRELQNSQGYPDGCDTALCGSFCLTALGFRQIYDQARLGDRSGLTADIFNKKCNHPEAQKYRRLCKMLYDRG